MDERLRYWLMELFEAADREKFYGTLSFGFRNGRVTVAEKKETMLPPAEVSQNGTQRAGEREPAHT